jgi:oligoribonuclease NrnB/cAMP/cGMP phosphodiesterase (DHH superfamily)
MITIQKYQTALKTVCTPEEQRELFAEYFEELATPKDAPNFNNQPLKESERRFKLINEISKSEEKKKIIVTIEEVEKAIQKLNSGKAADEYGITAEHVKFAVVL